MDRGTIEDRLNSLENSRLRFEKFILEVWNPKKEKKKSNPRIAVESLLDYLYSERQKKRNDQDYNENLDLVIELIEQAKFLL